MSDWVLNVVPTDPEFVAPKRALTAALKKLVKSFEFCHDPEAQTYPEQKWVDQGEMIDSFTCPTCQQTFSLFEPEYDETLHNWVLSKLHRSMAKGPSTRVKLPKCGHTVATATISFASPAAYARTVLTVWNPTDTYPPLEPAILKDVGAILGCEVHEIWAHY